MTLRACSTHEMDLAISGDRAWYLNIVEKHFHILLLHYDEYFPFSKKKEVILWEFGFFKTVNIIDETGAIQLMPVR